MKPSCRPSPRPWTEFPSSAFINRRPSATSL
jgi:hypothetical protein